NHRYANRKDESVKLDPSGLKFSKGVAYQAGQAGGSVHHPSDHDMTFKKIRKPRDVFLNISDERVVKIVEEIFLCQHKLWQSQQSVRMKCCRARTENEESAQESERRQPD